MLADPEQIRSRSAQDKIMVGGLLVADPFCSRLTYVCTQVLYKQDYDSNLCVLP